MDRYKLHLNMASNYCYIHDRRWYYYLNAGIKNKDVITDFGDTGENTSVPVNNPPHNPSPNLQSNNRSRTTPSLLAEHPWSEVKTGLVVQLETPGFGGKKRRLFSLFPNYVDFLKYEQKFPLEERCFFETIFIH